MVGKTLGHYEILEPLGAGGMGEVYRARDGKLKRDVAIKVLTEELSTDPAYLQAERKKGILRWEIEVPGQAVGPEALSLEYQLRLEYDKQMTIAGLPVAE